MDRLHSLGFSIRTVSTLKSLATGLSDPLLYPLCSLRCKIPSLICAFNRDLWANIQAWTGAAIELYLRYLATGFSMTLQSGVGICVFEYPLTDLKWHRTGKNKWLGTNMERLINKRIQQTVLQATPSVNSSNHALVTATLVYLGPLVANGTAIGAWIT